MSGLCFLALLTVSLPSAYSSTSIFELQSTVPNLLQSIAKVWNVVNDKTEFIEAPKCVESDNDEHVKKCLRERLRKYIVTLNWQKIDPGISLRHHQRLKKPNPVSKLNVINDHLSEITDAISLIDEQIEVLEPELFKINTLYEEMKAYLHDTYQNHTLLTLYSCDRMLSVNPLIESIHTRVINNDYYLQSREKEICNQQKESQQQALLRFLNQMILINVKSYMLVQTAYMFKKMRGQGNFTREIQLSQETFMTRINKLVTKIKPYVVNSSREIWMCDPVTHIEGKTYLQITNFIHGYIKNQCPGDPNSQPHCSNPFNCEFKDDSITVCALRLSDSGRRYDFVEFGNGQVYGKKKNCQNRKTLRSYWTTLQKCFYQFCICDEGEKRYTDKFISLRPSTVRDNRVVTGVRFVKRNRIIHLQVQEGKLLEYGKIDNSTVRWVPMDDFNITDRDVHKDKDFHMISWENSSLLLTDSRLHLRIVRMRFNFTSGKLKPSTSSNFQYDNNFFHKISELKLENPDVPVLVRSNSFTTKQYVQFTYTDLEKDAAQTTVPFFDAQNVTSLVAAPLSGIGIFHKGAHGSGGFITLRIFTYDLAPHLEEFNFSLGRD